MKLYIFLILILFGFHSFGQDLSKLKGSWIVPIDSAENLILTRDSITLVHMENVLTEGYVYHISFYFNDSSAYIIPETWAASGGSSRHRPFSPKGVLTFLNDHQLMWLIETWNNELDILFEGKVYFDFTLEDKNLTLIRNRQFD
jgi:hypothetical protein